MSDEGRYSRVSRRVWGDERFRRFSAPKPNAQTLWLRLLTGPELGPVPGLFSAREPGLADALGWSLSAFRRCWAEIEREGMVKRDWRAGVVWIPNSISHNPPANPNVIKSWRLALLELPECDLKREACAEIGAYCHSKGWGDAWALASGKGFTKPIVKSSAEGLGHVSRKQDQDQEQEQESERARDPEVPAAEPPERELPIDHHTVGREWQVAYASAGHTLSHGSDQWRGDFTLIASAIRANVPDGHRHLATRALCRWFWLAPDGPIRGERIIPGYAFPSVLAKRVDADLERARLWWNQQRQAAQEAAQ